MVPTIAQHSFTGVPAGAGASIGARVVRLHRLQRAAFNGIAAAPLDVLAARFPVIRRLAGNESFNALARRYIVAEPPGSGWLVRYGETFPGFLRSQGNSASIEYVADVAQLEMVLGKARQAASAIPLESPALQSLPGNRLDRTRLVLHPSAFLVGSRFPIVTIWENNRCGGRSGTIDRWSAEFALLARPFADVEMWRLPQGTHAFIGLLGQGASIAAAAEGARLSSAKFDFAQSLAILIQTHIVCGVSQ